MNKQTFKYPIIPADQLPERVRRPMGRRKSINNDEVLVKEGVEGIPKLYKSYNAAGKALASRAMERVLVKKNGKITFENAKSATSLENIARRLAQKISKAYKLKHYGQ